MIQLAPNTKIYICVESVDFRKGIDGLAAICRLKLRKDPFSGAIFLFSNRNKTSIKAIIYDGQGFWLCQKRLSKGRFRWWPTTALLVHDLSMYQLHVFLGNGNPDSAEIAEDWREVG